MQKFRNYLEEGISPIVFHRTNLDALYKMFKKDQFFLSAAEAVFSDAEAGSQKFWFLSTSRSKVGGYTVSNFYKENFQFVLTLDGRKLGNNYAGKAVDYWGPSFRDIDPKKFESEDRIYNDKPTIPDFRKYVKGLHIFAPKTGTDNEWQRRTLKRVLILAKKSKVPVFFYDTEQSFYLQKKPIKYNLGLLHVNAKEQFTDRHRKYNAQEAAALYRLMTYKNFDHIVNKDDELAYKMMYKFRYDSFYDMVNNIRYTFRAKENDARKVNAEIFKFMKKNKIKDAEALAIYVKDRVLKMTGK